MIKTAQDAYLAGRQAAMEKVAGMPLAALRGALKPGVMRGAAAAARRAPSDMARRRLGQAAGGLMLGTAGYGAYRMLTDKDYNFDPALGVGGTLARNTINRYKQ